LRYRLGHQPTVRVLDPILRPREGSGALPHVYARGDLCLSAPGEWNSSMAVGRTIVPWASEWLLHYEIWHATGDWAGGGRHPPAAA
jgi:hypothetical protein